MFYSQLTCFDGTQVIEIDSRTSDAIALALRFKCPIFTTEYIMEKAGIIIDFEQDNENMSDESMEMEDYQENETYKSESLTELSLEELKKSLAEAVKDEDYEKASQIRDEINRRK